MNPSHNYDDDDGDVDDNYDPEAEIGFDSKGPSVLPEVPVVTGEETENTLTKFRVKLYRWNDNQWKERGAGDLKFLENKESKKIRILMRQDKTGKVIANFYVSEQSGLCKLLQNKTTEKAWLWTCYDFSDEKAKIEKLCARLTTVEEFNRFKDEFEKAIVINKTSQAKKEDEEEKKEQ